MRIEAPPRIRRPLPLTPLVDVVFLLLMFFMLSSTFSKFGGIELSRASPSTGQTGLAPVKSGVIINVLDKNRLTINGQPASLDSLVDQLNVLNDRGARSAIMTFSPKAEVQDLVDVLERARRSNLRPISLAN